MGLYGWRSLFQLQMTLDPTLIEDEATLAETIRMPLARDASHLWRIMEETGAVLLSLDSDWWGNEALGYWANHFLVQPAGSSEKALHVGEGVTVGDATGYLRAAEDARQTRGGLTSKGARKLERKAFNWFDDSEKPGPGMPPVDHRESFKDEWVPFSTISEALVSPEGAEAQDADVRVTGTTESEYGMKTVLQGDTYNVFKVENVDQGVDIRETGLTFDGDSWVCDHDLGAHEKVEAAIEEAGFTTSGFLTEE